MFRAAFTSRSCTVPHAAQAHSRTLSGFGPSCTPQAEHTWLVGSKRRSGRRCGHATGVFVTRYRHPVLTGWHLDRMEQIMR